MDTIRRTCVLIAALTEFAVLSPVAQAQVVLSSNLSSATTDIDTASSNRWLAVSFTTGTGTTAYTLTSATLRVSTTTGTPILSLYSDGTFQPGTLLTTLTAPSSFSSTVTDTAFTSSNVNLSANTTYWLVLRSSTGSFNWAWTSTNTGSGAGYTNTWADTDDAGATWFSSDAFPFLFSVTATPVPEPSSMALAASAIAAAWVGRRTKLGKSKCRAGRDIVAN